MFPRCPNIPLVHQLLLGVLSWCCKLYSSHHGLNHAKKWVLKNHPILHNIGDLNDSIMSYASTSPAPHRWYMMYWMTFVHQDVRRLGHIVSHHHHFVVIYILPNDSYPVRKVIAISNNMRYYDFPTARELFCSVPTCSNPKGLTQLSKMAMVQSCHHSPQIWDVKNGRHLTFSGLHNIPRTQLPNALI